jgi:hypothetical protein
MLTMWHGEKVRLRLGVVNSAASHWRFSPEVFTRFPDFVAVQRHIGEPKRPRVSLTSLAN